MRSVMLVFAILVLAFASSCSKQPSEQGNGAASPASSPGASTATSTAGSRTPAGSPSNKFTAADIAKLKWLEGTWRGVHDDKPFFERYRFEDTTMIVETLSGEDLSKVEDTSRFELTDGEFGHTRGKRRSAATEITDQHVQFVPVTGGGNNFRFERQADGTWRAVLEWIGQDNEPKQKIYKMEPYKK